MSGISFSLQRGVNSVQKTLDDPKTSLKKRNRDVFGVDSDNDNEDDTQKQEQVQQQSVGSGDQQNLSPKRPKTQVLCKSSMTTESKTTVVKDSVAAMEEYAKLVAKKQTAAVGSDHEEKPPKDLLNETTFDQRKTYAIFKSDGSRGHHIQDFIPQEDLARFLSKCQDSRSKNVAKNLENQSKINMSNIGHKLLSKMGWKEGEGLGASGHGRVAPVEAGQVKNNNVGLGAKDEFEVHEQDDIFEQYRKRMMLGYKHRPNPLGNPRKKYY
eukprot:TRINITY_DN5619_c0_g1_i11.p1 TRINITY_DN5619_c0_g1~~TRINITY_DN5619_c0_g1_i11.p1  ORF type:complete len:286 (+),score=53.43 TRINITY_DN5619_c0_g1_i11:55-858(+)